MEALLAHRPFLAVLVSALAAVAIVATGERRRNLREGWTLLASLAKLALIASMVPGVLAGERYEVRLLELSPGVELALRADATGILFALSASFLWVLTSLFAIGYMRGAGERDQTRFFAMLAVCLSATMGIALAANLLTLVVFYEILSIATYPLVVHSGSAEAYRIGRQYLVYALTAGMALVGGIALVHHVAGTLEFRPGGMLPEATDPVLLAVIFGLFFVGFAVKGGVMPLHSWLPNAMIAPTPVSALLHAVAVVKAGVFGFVRLGGFVFGPELLAGTGLADALAVVAALTILLASLIAMTKDDLKARLAYSTVGHLSYIVLGVALLGPLALQGGVFHMVTHAMMKITLFFCAGALAVHLGLKKVSQLDGVGRRMPLTLGAFAVGTLGLMGVPGTAGFVSKWFVAQGAVEVGQPVFVAVLLLSGLLNAGYLLPVVTRAFFRSAPEHVRFDEASWWMVAPLLVTAAIVVMLGLAPGAVFHFFELAEQAAGAVFAAGRGS